MWKRSRVCEDDIPFLESITNYVKEKMRDVREPCHVMIDSAARKRSENRRPLRFYGGGKKSVDRFVREIR